MEKRYYCSKCMNLVFPESKRPTLNKILGVGGEKFCEQCGHTTEDAIAYYCVNEHPMRFSDKFCTVCGSPKEIDVKSNNA